MKGSYFVFDGVSLLYKCYKHGGSYIDSPDWMKKKEATINQKNKDDKCFQYAATLALIYGGIKWNPERISIVKPFINKYNRDEIKYLSKIDD